MKKGDKRRERRVSVRSTRSEYDRGIFQGGGGKKGAESSSEEYCTN